MNHAEFLGQLWGPKPDGHYALIWTLQDKRSQWFRMVEDAAAAVAAVRDRMDVYVGVGTRARDMGPGQRGGEDAVSGICGMWADVDFQSSAHPNKTLPRTMGDALRIFPHEMPPTIVVQSGNGMHAWWLFKEPWMFDSPEERGEARKLSMIWHTLLKLQALKFGYHYDRLFDLSRILRIPGTWNFKGDTKIPVRVTRETAQRYNPSDFSEYLEDMRITEETAHKMQNYSLPTRPNADGWRDWRGRIQVREIDYPGDWLWEMAEHKKVLRDVLNNAYRGGDNTQSARDMAVANTLIEAAPLQTVADVLVWMRTRSGENLEKAKREDYLLRTLWVASNYGKRMFSELPTTPEMTAQVAADSPADPTPENEDPMPRDPDFRRGLTYDRLSQAWGVNVTAIEKQDGDNPVYIFHLPVGQMAVTYETLNDWKRFEAEIAKRTDKKLRPYKAQEWQRIVADVLENLVKMEGTEDTFLVGKVKHWLHEYLLTTSWVDSESFADDAQSKAKRLRLPCIWYDEIAIRAQSLRAYVNRHAAEGGEKLTADQIGVGLNSLHARVLPVVPMEGANPEKRWILLRDEWPMQRYRGQRDKIAEIEERAKAAAAQRERLN